MDWKDIANDIAKVAPVLGAAMGGPAGDGIGSLIASALGCNNNPSDVQQALTVNPDAAVKLKELETQVTIAQITAGAQQIDAVNKTLQTEAMGGSFWQKNHHAFESTFAVLLVGLIYFGLPIAKIPVPDVPAEAWLMIMAILGVAAYQRGQANVEVAKKG